MKTAGIRKECLIGKDSIIGEKTAQISTGSCAVCFISYLPILSHLFKIHVLAHFFPDYDADDHCKNSLKGHSNQSCKSNVACLYIARNTFNLEECHGNGTFRVRFK